MTFGIFTHVPHSLLDQQYYAYGPYVKEMNLWGRHVDKIVVVAPKTQASPTTLDIAYSNKNFEFITIPSFSLLGILAVAKALVKVPIIAWRIFWAMRKVDHIHLRCPGNIGLIACFVQILFPKKPKTAKYAGNWDPKAKQPWSYRLQKNLLSNTLFTKNMHVLAYGSWPNQSKNVKSFFTASYYESQITPVDKQFTAPFAFMFVGTLSPGKQPLKAIQLVQELSTAHANVSLDIYGEGVERSALQQYIESNNLASFVKLYGNRPPTQIEEAYKKAHFLILNSKSEGWPKVVAEAMFWGAIPLVSAVSCVPWMLNNETAGLLLNDQNDVQRISQLINDSSRMSSFSQVAMHWSRTYTLDRFQTEIQKLLDA
jgi:glycosyltransferase involved in cell wall biosynthesis